MFLHAIYHYFAFLRTVVRLAVAIVSVIGGKYVGGISLLGLGDTQCDIALAKCLPGGITEPGVVAEFESRPDGTRQTFQELRQHDLISLEIRRQLKKDRSEAAG